ncbi:hypothetical protein F5J12DRAFT_785903 [Pisolithus orientalis]|uniref:uncharacterized protein n=1 Tax=Pisolithus orientalis TaxID=936130 RepID=UPI00222497A1|nr:uncharacterized protein F5J12DRAFT_785903 [Pisolithus orientalis]KAI5993766.1 hypothetical protein F5J12DRAFT_785903 [Pisolithus orientalis]
MQPTSHGHSPTHPEQINVDFWKGGAKRDVLHIDMEQTFSVLNGILPPGIICNCPILLRTANLQVPACCRSAFPAVSLSFWTMSSVGMRQDSPPEYRDVTGLKEEIADLVGEVNGIDKKYLQIRRALSETTLDPNDQFKEFHESYVQLVWKSRETAAKAGAVTKDFCGDLLTYLLDADVTNDEKVTELEAVIKYWQGSSEIDCGMGQDFDSLCDALGDFSTTIRERLEDAQTAERALRHEIDEVNKEISRCESGSGRPPTSLPLASGLPLQCGSLHLTSAPVANLRPALRYLGYRCVSENEAIFCMGVRTGAGLTFTLTSEALRISALASKSILHGSPGGAVEVVVTSLKEGTANLLHILEAPGGAERAKEALTLQLAARLDALRTTDRAIDKSAAILKDVNNLKSDTSSLSSKLTCLNDVYNLLTKESLELIELVNANLAGVDHSSTSMSGSRCCLARHILSSLCRTGQLCESLKDVMQRGEGETRIIEQCLIGADSFR